MIKINASLANKFYEDSHDEIEKQQHILKSANWARSRYIDILKTALVKIDITLGKSENSVLKQDLQKILQECEKEIEYCNNQILTQHCDN